MDEALRLMEMSKNALAGDDSEGTRRVRNRPLDQIYRIIVEMMNNSPNETSYKIDDITNSCGKQGFTQEQIMEAIEEYENLNVWIVNSSRTKLTRVF